MAGVERPEGQPRTITESVSTRAIDALMSNYRDPQQAFLELIDNAVDNRVEGKPLSVRTRVSKNELSVYNEGGRGLDFEGLENFFVWGYSEKTAKEIGFYGVGGKAAMGYLGRSMEVICSAAGSNEEYRIFDPAWETRDLGEWKQYEPETKKAGTTEGYFRVRVTNLKKEVSSNALVAKLSDIYRPLLLDGSVSIKVNNQDVSPLQINYVEDDSNLAPQVARIQTRFGDWINVKVGVLQEGQKVKPGIRCYYRGRMIEDEQFFGAPTPAQMPQMSRLIGEIHLDSVPVTTNKNSFDKGSVQYQEAVKRLQLVLQPWVDKISKLKVEQTNPVQSFERDLARRAKRVLEHVFATTGLVTKAELPGESEGRLPPTQSRPPRQQEGTPRGPREGQTSPRLDATVSEVKRWGVLMSWDVAPMGSSGKRAQVILDEGKFALKINSDFGWYQAAKNAGEEALGLYILETGIWQICNMVTKDKPREEADELYERSLRESGHLAQTEFKVKRGSSRGTINFRP